MTTTVLTHQTPEQYLTAADQEFAAGNHNSGSELLYQSVICALTQLADDYGRPCGTPGGTAQFRRLAGQKARRQRTPRPEIANGGNISP